MVLNIVWNFGIGQKLHFESISMCDTVFGCTSLCTLILCWLEKCGKISANIMDGDDDNNHSETAQVEKSCFSYGFRPIYYFSRAIGLMPYTVIYNLNGEIQEHRFHIRDALWLLSSFCLYLSVILHVFRDMKLPQDPNSTMYIFILGNARIIHFTVKRDCFFWKEQVCQEELDAVVIVQIASIHVTIHSFESVIFESLIQKRILLVKIR